MTVALWHTHPGKCGPQDDFSPLSLTFSRGAFSDETKALSVWEDNSSVFIGSYLGNYCGQVRKLDPREPLFEFIIAGEEGRVFTRNATRPECQQP